MKNNKKGYTLIESIVSLLILLTILVVVFPSYFSILKNEEKEHEQIDMLFYALSKNEEGIEVYEITERGFIHESIKNGNYIETIVMQDNIKYHFKRYQRRY